MFHPQTLFNYISFILLVASSIEAHAQPFNPQQIKLIQDNATVICNKVNELRGNKTKAQIEGDVKAKLKGLANKLADATLSGSLSGSFEDFEGLSQDATAAALDAERGCRERVFNKMFDALVKSMEKSQRKQDLVEQKSKPINVPQDKTPKQVNVLGRWIGPVACENGQDFKLFIEFVQKIGSSTIGFSRWWGATSGTDRTTLMIDPNAQDTLGYILISDRPDVYKYKLQIPNLYLIQGHSTGNERCSIKLERE